MFKWAFWLSVLGAGVFVGGQVIPIYYNNLKVQNIFNGVSENISRQTENKVIERMNELFAIQTIDLEALPPEFFDNLAITHENDVFRIGTEYHIRLWLLGPPESVDPDKPYKESDVKPKDKLRLRARMDFDFAPFATSP